MRLVRKVSSREAESVGKIKRMYRSSAASRWILCLPGQTSVAEAEEEAAEQ
jgi:hypothetical protein